MGNPKIRPCRWHSKDKYFFSTLCAGWEGQPRGSWGPEMWAGQLQTGASFPRGRDQLHNQPHTVQMEGRDSGCLLSGLTSSELKAPGAGEMEGSLAQCQQQQRFHRSLCLSEHEGGRNPAWHWLELEDRCWMPVMFPATPLLLLGPSPAA